jgi:hypothetical protein
MMTRKHFTELAAAVSELGELGESGPQLVMARRLAEICAADNPQFDRSHFMAACGVDPAR